MVCKSELLFYSVFVPKVGEKTNKFQILFPRRRFALPLASLILLTFSIIQTSLILPSLNRKINFTDFAYTRHNPNRFDFAYAYPQKNGHSF